MRRKCLHYLYSKNPAIRRTGTILYGPTHASAIPTEGDKEVVDNCDGQLEDASEDDLYDAEATQAL